MRIEWPNVVAAVVLLCPLVTGCGKSGPEKYAVSGKVTFQGQPVGEGTVQFHNPDVGSVGTKLAASGEFSFAELGGLTAGNYKVYVQPPQPVMAPPAPGGKHEVPPPKEYPNIPLQYREVSSTDLTATVKSGENKLTFDMK